jgi:glucose/arabinose dehydrogenase
MMTTERNVKRSEMYIINPGKLFARISRVGLGVVAAILVLVLAACTIPGQATMPANEAPGGPVQTSPGQTGAVTVQDGTDEGAETVPAGDGFELAVEAAEAEIPPTVFDPGETSVSTVLLFDGLSNPLFVTHAGDGTDRLFVVEKVGRIMVYGPERGQGQVFLDIQERVRDSGYEQGLLGLAFAPGYAESGHFFVNYTDRNGDTVIARYTVSAGDPDQADAASESVVLTLAQPAANHNGGHLAFGPDGYLWIGTGDGGRSDDAFGHGQNPQTLLGAMLRIDVTDAEPYAIPEDNPWVEETWEGQEVRDEIWGIGLRNPWRYSFDRATGDLWIADVGQRRYEEVHFVPADHLAEGGINFGWPIMEGTHCFQAANCDTTGLDIPLFDYDHSNGCSITGGYVYRGEAYPELEGVYFFGDYCSGRIWAFWTHEGGDPQLQLLLESGLRISSFGEDEAGEIYITDIYGGRVYQLQVE